MQKKVLITGISGFAGSHLAEYLVTQPDIEVFGTILGQKTIENLASIKDHVSLTSVDLQNQEDVRDLIKNIRPDFVYHLAALPSPAESFKNPSLFLTNNITVQVNILEALKEEKLYDTRILIVSSAEIYGLVAESDIPVNEHVPLRPTSPYAVSKIAQDYLGLQYFLSYKLPIVRVRPFNHVGSRLSPKMVVSAFAKQIAEIEKNNGGKIRVGNLESRRDFTDVTDMARAYKLALEKGTPGDVYNIGTGVSHKIADILNILLSLSKVKIEVEVDPALLRPSDIPELRCDTTKFYDATGWKPTIPLEETLKRTLDYWRDIV